MGSDRRLARIGRPDIPWSVNKLARSITKWTKACDKRSSRLISHIHLPSVVGNTAQQCRLGLSQDSDFAGDFDDPKINIKRNSMHFRKSHVCANKLDVQETYFSFTQFNRSGQSFLSMQVYAWTVFPLSVIGIWWLKHFILYRTKPKDPRENYGKTRRQLSCKTCMTPSQSSTPTSFQQSVITFHQIQRILVPVLFACLWRQWGGNENDYQK